MINYVIYDQYGNIFIEGTGPLDSVDCSVFGEGFSVLAVNTGVRSDLHYVQDGQLLERSTLPITLSKSIISLNELAVFSNLPDGTEVTWPDGFISYATVVDNVIEFSTDMEGTYTFSFTCPGYLAKEITIEARP